MQEEPEALNQSFTYTDYIDLFTLKPARKQNGTSPLKIRYALFVPGKPPLRIIRQVYFLIHAGSKTITKFQTYFN